MSEFGRINLPLLVYVENRLVFVARRGAIHLHYRCGAFEGSCPAGSCVCSAKLVDAVTPSLAGLSVFSFLLWEVGTVGALCQSPPQMRNFWFVFPQQRSVRCIAVSLSLLDLVTLSIFPSGRGHLPSQEIYRRPRLQCKGKRKKKKKPQGNRATAWLATSLAGKEWNPRGENATAYIQPWIPASFIWKGVVQSHEGECHRMRQPDSADIGKSGDDLDGVEPGRLVAYRLLGSVIQTYFLGTVLYISFQFAWQHQWQVDNLVKGVKVESRRENQVCFWIQGDVQIRYRRDKSHVSSRAESLEVGRINSSDRGIISGVRMNGKVQCMWKEAEGRESRTSADYCETWGW